MFDGAVLFSVSVVAVIESLQQNLSHFGRP
jgi:hypothetical protein